MCRGCLFTALELKPSHRFPIWNFLILTIFSLSLSPRLLFSPSFTKFPPFFFVPLRYVFTVCVLYTQGVETKQWREVSAHTNMHTQIKKERTCSTVRPIKSLPWRLCAEGWSGGTAVKTFTSLFFFLHPFLCECFLTIHYTCSNI